MRPQLLPLLLLVSACVTDVAIVTPPEADDDGDGYVASEDCDDQDASINPGAVEVCDSANVDEDCSGLSDDEDPDVDTESLLRWFADADGDGHGDRGSWTEACDQPDGYVENDGDCNDGDEAYHPGAKEEDCTDPNDYNCDGSSGYTDADGDGWAACEDCDDADAALNPGATEVCDDQDIDEDCSGAADDADEGVDPSSMATWYADADGDGYGDPASTVQACDEPSGYLADDQDCDDTLDTVNPDAIEVCDGVDNNCDPADDPDILVPVDQPSIQDALDNAVYADWICIQAGTYYETDLTPARSVTVTGEDRETTIIDGGGGDATLLSTDGVHDLSFSGLTLTNTTGRAVRVESSEDVVFDDLLVTGIDGTVDGQGMWVSSSGSISLEGVDFVGISSTRSHPYGTVLRSTSSELTLQNVRVLDSVGVATHQCMGMLWVQGSDLVMQNVLIAGNTCQASDDNVWIGAPGVVTSGGSTVYAENVALVGNYSDAGTDGDVTATAWYTYSSADVVELVNVDISYNTIGDAGGGTKRGFYAHSSASVTASYTNVYGNDGGPWDNTHDPLGADGCMESDPLYTDLTSDYAEDWDFVLGTGSALIDAGDPSISDADGSTSDIGAFGGPLGESYPG